MTCSKYIIIATSVDNEYNKATEILGQDWIFSSKDGVEVDDKNKIAQENLHFVNRYTNAKRTLRFDVSSFFFASVEEKIEMTSDPEEKERIRKVDNIARKIMERITKRKNNDN